MITDYQNNGYRISYQGVSMIENALDNPNLIQIGVSSGCTIMVAPEKDYGIDYLPNGEYKTWKLTGYNTRLNRTEEHYIYARLTRNSDTAMILFSVNEYAIDGSIGGQNPSEYYYYIRIGKITATDKLEEATLDREITLDYGKLSTPAGQTQDTAGWKELFSVTADDLIRPLKKFTSYIVQGTLSIIGKLVINDKQISDVARQVDEGEFSASDELIPTTALLVGKYITKIREYFLSKDREDQTKFLLRLIGGAEFGTYASGISGAKISPDGAAELLNLLLRGALTIGDYQVKKSGARIDEEGVADLLSILVRSGIESANFSTGALGAGFCLKKDENGDSYLEVDRMLVRKVATFIQLLIQQIKHVGGQIILTPASMSCVKVEDKGDYYRCYFENTDGEKTIEQEFEVGDLARAQTFNVKEGVNDNVTNTYYWRAVVGTGDNYIDLSKTDCDAGSTEPKAGDDIVQLGNKSDATRQAAIILSAYGNDAPYFKLYRGINSYSLDGKEFVSFSRSEVMIIADTIRFSSGESVKDYIDNAVGEVNTKVDDAIADLSENISFVNQLSNDLEAVKNQVDGAIETWFYEPVPTLSNEPAVNWTTNEDKNVHLGDLYYDGDGKAYRFQMSGTSYVWQVITDSDITKALADAKKAQDTADGKRRVFVTTPTNASVYDIGDLWVNATYGSYKNDLLRCKTAKQANAQFSIEHWELASRYTDDTKANQAQAAADAAKQAADSAQQTANNAVQSASTANALLSDIANDNKLTAQEKQETKKEWDIIVSEKSKNDASADKYGVSKTAYDTAYSALSTYITPLLSSLSTTSNISGTTFRSKFKDYYDARTDMLNAISAKAKSLADAAQQTADKAQQQANQAIKDAANAKVAANNAQSDADEAKSRLDSWASDGSISPTEKQSLKEEISRIDADKTQIANGYAKYNLGTPTNYNNAHTTYRAVLVTLTASTPETIAIPSDFSTKQTTYYTQRTTALTAISNAARDYAQGIANDLSSYKQTVTSQFEQTNNSITAAVTSSKEYTDSAVGEVNTSLAEYKQEVTTQLSILEGEISSKVSSTEITTLKAEILDSAATDATNKANQAKNDAITTAGSNADKKYATITTVSSMQTVIEQHSEDLLLKAEKTEVTAVQNNLDKTNSNLSSLTTRVSEAEVKLQPDNIWIGISSKVTTTAKVNNIVPDSCFEDANYSLLYSGGSRVSAATANNSCPTSYCMKSSQRDVNSILPIPVTSGEKYYVSAYVNAGKANHNVGIGLLCRNASKQSKWIPAKVITKGGRWQQIFGYITIPDGYIDARIWFQIDGSSDFGSAYFTKVYAYKVDESVNQNYALLTSTEKKLTTFSNISNQTWNVYNITGLKKGDIITVSFEYEASNLNFNTTTEHTAKINCQFGSLYGWAGTNFDLKSNGSGKYISKPITVGGTATETAKDNIFFRLDYISSVLQDNNPIGYFRVWNLKVEKGERATPWSAAPSDYSTTEEIKTGITVKENAISIFGKDISLQGKITFSSLNSSLQSTINNKADSGDVTSDINSSKEDMAKKLGYASYADMVSAATAGNTIIEGGHIRTSLIEADALVVKTLNAVNTDGVSTLVSKDGMKMTQGSNVLFKLTSNKATVGTTRYYAQMDLTTVYSDGSTLQGTLTPESLFLRGKTKSTDKTLKTSLMYNGLTVYDENGTGLTVNTKGVQLTYCGRTQGGSDVCLVVHYAKCIFSAQISALGSFVHYLGGGIPNVSGTPIEFSVTKTATGTYKVTHNIGDITYHVQVSPIRGTYFPVACVREQQTTYFVYTTAYNAPSGGVYGLKDGDCAVFVNVYYESPLLFTF